MRSHSDTIDTTHTPPPLSFYNTFKTVNVKNVSFFQETKIMSSVADTQL
jgi:hypothetical protein